MKVSFKSEGGFGIFPGLNKAVEIDSNELPAEEANELKKLVNNSAFFSQPPVITASPAGRDVKTYTISIQDNDQQHQVKINEENESPELQNLVGFLRKKQKENRGK